MFLLKIFFENAKWNGSDKFCFNKDHGKIRKWTLLPPGKASQELLRLMAIAWAGIDFVPTCHTRWRKYFAVLLNRFGSNSYRPAIHLGNVSPVILQLLVVELKSALMEMLISFQKRIIVTYPKRDKSGSTE